MLGFAGFKQLSKEEWEASQRQKHEESRATAPERARKRELSNLIRLRQEEKARAEKEEMKDISAERGNRGLATGKGPKG